MWPDLGERSADTRFRDDGLHDGGVVTRVVCASSRVVQGGELAHGLGQISGVEFTSPFCRGEWSGPDRAGWNVPGARRHHPARRLVGSGSVLTAEAASGRAYAIRGEPGLSPAGALPGLTCLRLGHAAAQAIGHHRRTGWDVLGQPLGVATAAEMTWEIFRPDGPGREVMAAGSWYRGTPAALVEISPVAVPDPGLAAGDISNAACKALDAPVAGVPGTGPPDLPRHIAN
jgi:hypothetical protein